MNSSRFCLVRGLVIASEGDALVKDETGPTRERVCIYGTWARARAYY